MEGEDGMRVECGGDAVVEAALVKLPVAAGVKATGASGVVV